MIEPTRDFVCGPVAKTSDSDAHTEDPAFELTDGGSLEVVLSSRYRLLRVLGRGASAVVYEALDLLRAEQRVALKLLIARQPHALLRLKEEFRGLSRVVHPNLVRLHGLGMDAHGWFVVMDVVPSSRDFFSYVRPGGALDEARLRVSLAGLLHGVAALHAAGKAHRDLKPSNVLVDGQGRVVIVDFGLNCEMSGDALPEGHFVGTPAYAPPEQVRGATIGPAADLFAVGVMLYQALFGTLPHEERAPVSTHYDSELSPVLTSLCVALRAPEPTQRPSVRECLRALGESTLGLAERRVSRFVGRSSVIDELLDTARSARHDGLRLTVLRGSSGVGKTALLAHFGERLRSEPETVVLSGRCHPLEQVPYKAVDSLVDALVGYLTGLSAVDAAVLMPRDVSLLALMFPTLSRVPVVQHMPAQRLSTDAPAHTRKRAFGALKELLSRIADRQLLAICLDDLQWSDDDSCELLRELLRGPEAPACFFLCTCRSDHALPSAIDEALDSLPAGGGREHTLAPLSEAEASALARALVGEDGAEDQLRLLVSEAAGSPFLLEALALGARTTGVHDLRTVLGARVDALSTTERTILEVVCLAGQPLALTLCLRAAQTDASALSPLLGAALLRTTWEDGRECLESYHDRVRQTVTCALSPERRTFLHGRLASLLAEAELGDPALVAQHFHGAGRDREAAPYWLRAAERAALALAFGRAANLYTHALSLASSQDERQHILLALAHTYASQGQVDQAAAHYERVQVAPGADATQRELMNKAMMMHFLAGHSDQGARLLAELCRQLGVPQAPRRTWLVTLSVLVMFVRYLGGGRLGRRALPQVERHRGTSRQALSLCMHAARGLSVVSLPHSEYFVLLAMLSVRRHRDRTHWPVAIAWEVLRRSTLRGVTSRRDEQDMARALQLAKQAGDPENLSLVWGAEGGRCYAIGALRRSIEAFDRAEQVLQQEGRSVVPVLHGTRTGRCAAWLVRGALNAVDTHGQVWQCEAKALGDPITELCLEVMSSYLLLANGDARGMREVSGLLDTPNGKRTLLTADPWWRGEPALHEQHAGDALAAYDNARRSHVFAAVQRIPFHRAWTSLYLGRAAMLAAREGDRARWLRVVRRQAAAAARERYLGGAAIAAHLRAGLLLLEDQPERAVDQLSVAAVRYEALGIDAHAATMRYFIGHIRGGEGGADTKQAASSDMHALGIPAAERWFYAGLPAASR